MALTLTVCGQGANNIRLNEVMTNNQTSIQDEYGCCTPWVEIVNTSYSTYDIRGMYITTDRTTLDKTMSVPERMKHMSIIPDNDSRTTLSARQHVLFRLNSSPSKGAMHLNAKVDSLSPTWIAIFDGNAIDLIDSVTVPLLTANASYARKSDGSSKWVVRTGDAVTPGIDNFIQIEEPKLERLKRDDPHGLGITALCMGIVFLSLALLYAFFLIFGWTADRRSKLANVQPIKPVVQTAKKIEKVRQVTTNILQDGFETRGRDKEIYIAVISLALRQYANDIHDVESGIISIKPHHTEWSAHNTMINHNI